MQSIARKIVLVGIVAVLPALAPRPARADGILGAFIGTNFGGKAEVKTTTYGGVLGGVRARGLGFEVDLGYSPDFFDTEETTGSKTSLTTVMGNLVIGGTSSGGVAPFVSGGIGLIRFNVDSPTDILDNLTKNDFGFNVGGGLNLLFGTFGLRADIRYFRSLEGGDDDGILGGITDFDLGTFDFWRATGGVVVRW